MQYDLRAIYKGKTMEEQINSAWATVRNGFNGKETSS